MESQYEQAEAAIEEQAEINKKNACPGTHNWAAGQGALGTAHTMSARHLILDRLESQEYELISQLQKLRELKLRVKIASEESCEITQDLVRFAGMRI